MTSARRAGTSDPVVGLTRPACGQLLTAHETAERLRVKVATLGTWRYQGVGPPYVKPKGRALYPADELEAWINRTA